MSKFTQKQLAFYKLYMSHAHNEKRYINAWEFVGEIFLKEFNEWGFMSYKCPTRLTDIMQDNPRLLERKLVEGKSGSKYFAYKIREGVSVVDVLDPSLLEIRKRVISSLNI